jgi:hypothetical protein
MAAFLSVEKRSIKDIGLWELHKNPVMNKNCDRCSRHERRRCITELSSLHFPGEVYH